MSFIKEHQRPITIFLASVGVLTIANYFLGPVFAGLFLSTATFFLFIYLFIRASQQVLQPKDGLTGLRYIILWFIVGAAVFSIPSIVYAISRLVGLELEWLRNATGITGGLSKIAAPILLALVFEYKQKE